MEEYNHQISFRADQLPITKISYVVNQNKEATMKITKSDNPLNLVVDPNFRLKTLGFSEWMEVHALASKKSRKSNDMLLQSEILKEVFVKENVVVDGMHKNLVPPPRIEGRQELVIREPKLQSSIQRSTPKTNEMFRKLELTIEARDDVDQARDIVKDNLDGLGQYIRIRVKYIVKEVEDYLKTYSSAEMDITWQETQYLLKARQKFAEFELSLVCAPLLFMSSVIHVCWLDDESVGGAGLFADCPSALSGYGDKRSFRLYRYLIAPGRNVVEVRDFLLQRELGLGLSKRRRISSGNHSSINQTSEFHSEEYSKG
ncbi:hypothetical protein Tco_0800336 [Tanacetum coccineum]|uniref:Uncharacterized protein n=1 Tax=Tanacetum coccineum TaxID=301880 RepID=A0ABQ4ZX98_9ASTR